MRTFGILVLVGVGFGAGYFTRAKISEPAPARAERDEAAAEDRRRQVIASLTEEERETILKRDYPDLIRLREQAREEAAQPVEEAPVETVAAEDDQIEEWLRSASGQWKAYAGMQAKNKVRGLLAGLGFDPETAKQIEEAIVKDVERQVDSAIAMMLGEEEMDAGAFTAMLGIPPTLSPELERELATYLSDEEIGAVRERVQGAHNKQMNDMADMQIASMGIRDLDADQKSRLREVFVGKDMMSQQMEQFADLTRNRKNLMSVLEDEEAFVALVEKNMEPQRRKVRDILNDEQYKRYQAFEKTIVQQAKMGMKMMSAMMKKPASKQ
ncbi:MAG: hypothetical protein ACYTHK_11485 [Planctomycetota bacterium]|jgi:hypothetical protein